MPRAWWSVAVALALAGPAAAGPADPFVPAPDTSNALNCGGLAPFSRTCVDPDRLRLSASPRPDLNGTAYVGRVIVEVYSIEDDDDDDDGFAIRWACDVLALELLMSCADPSIRGKPKAGRWVSLRCFAEPNPLLGLVNTGPYGPWACWVHMD